MSPQNRKKRACKPQKLAFLSELLLERYERCGEREQRGKVLSGPCAVSRRSLLSLSLSLSLSPAVKEQLINGCIRSANSLTVQRLPCLRRLSSDGVQTQRRERPFALRFAGNTGTVHYSPLLSSERKLLHSPLPGHYCR